MATDHLGDVELGHVLRQPVLELGEQGEKIAAAVVVHHQVLQVQIYKSLILIDREDTYKVKIDQDASDDEDGGGGDEGKRAEMFLSATC